MAILTNAIFIANSKYTYEINWNNFCDWQADIFETTIWLSNIKNTMISYINTNKHIVDNWLIVWYAENKWDFQEYVEIYVYDQRFKTYDEYRSNWKRVWFWYIDINSLKI